MADAENPFAKYVKKPSPASASGAENPFAKYAKKPAKPETPMSIISVEGMPVSFDPEEQKQIARSGLEFMKGMAAGVGEVPVGIAQAASDLAKKVVPQGWADYLKGLDEKLVGAEKYLESTGPEGAAGKVSRGIGQMAAMAAPGGVVAKGVGKGLEALGVAPQALAEGAGFGARLVERGKALASGLLGGGATGAGTAALQPSTKINPEERAKEREINTLEGAAAGGVLGAAPPLVKGVTSAAKSFGNVVERAKGAKAAEKIEQLRGDVLERATTQAQQEQAALAAKTAEKTALEKELTPHQQEMSRLEKAMNELAQRDQVRAAKGRDVAQATGPEIADIQKRAVEGWNRRVAALETEAQAQGLSKVDAEAFTRHEASKLVEAEKAAQDLADLHASMPTISPNEFGAKLRERVAAAEEAAETAREKAAGFAEAMKSAPEGPIVKTREIKDYIDEIEPEVADPSTLGVLNWAKQQLNLLEEAAPTAPQDARSAAEALFSKGVTAAGKAAEPGVTLAKLDSARKFLGGVLRSKNLKALTGIDASSSEAAYHLKKIYGLLMDAAKEAHAPYGKAVEVWRNESRALDKFRSGGLSNVTDTDLLSGEFTKMEGDVTATLLNKAKKGDPQLANLIASDPELKESARQYFLGELFGHGAVEKKKVTQAAFNSFWKNNQETLEKAGLADEFKSLQKVRADNELRIAKAKAELEARKAQEKKLTSELELTQARRDVARKRQLQVESGEEKNKFLQAERLPGGVKAKPETAVESAAAEKAKADAARLKEKAAPVKEKIGDVEGKISQAAKDIENHQKALAEFDKLERWFKDEPDANKVANEAKNFVDRQAARGAITPEDAAAIADKIREAVALNKDAEKAKAAVMSVLKVALAVGSMVAVGGTGGYIARMAGGAAMGGGH